MPRSLPFHLASFEGMALAALAAAEIVNAIAIEEADAGAWTLSAGKHPAIVTGSKRGPDEASTTPATPPDRSISRRSRGRFSANTGAPTSLLWSAPALSAAIAMALPFPARRSSNSPSLAGCGYGRATASSFRRKSPRSPTTKPMRWASERWIGKRRRSKARCWRATVSNSVTGPPSSTWKSAIDIVWADALRMNCWAMRRWHPALQACAIAGPGFLDDLRPWPSGCRSLRLSQVAGEGSVVYDLTDQGSVQTGGFATIFGRNALQKRGVIAAVWYRF